MSDQTSSATMSNPTSTVHETAPTYDLVCVGFGAAQIATAIAIRESKKHTKVLFVERKASFSWHSSQHLSRTRMENPFVYDLATVRNPRSAFSYVNYLLSRKRLVEFANSDRLNPLREEFDDYIQWCAEQFKSQVRYGCLVVKVVPQMDDDVVRFWNVTIRSGDSKEQIIQANSVVAPFPPGQNSVQPQALPSVDFLAGQRIIPLDEYNVRRNELRGAHHPELEIAVVGSGHETAEIVNDLLSCSRLGNITVVTDDETFAPLRVLGEQEAPPPRLCSIWQKPSNEKKSAVTEASELIQTIYMRAYEKRVGSKGKYGLRVVLGKDAAEACSKSHFIIRDTGVRPFPTSELLQDIDPLVLGCRSKGDSLDEIQFKRGSVDPGRHIFLMSSQSDGGRSLAKDIALTAGKVARIVSSDHGEQREGGTVQARI